MSDRNEPAEDALPPETAADDNGLRAQTEKNLRDLAARSPSDHEDAVPES